MGHAVKASQIAEFLDLCLEGQDIEIHSVKPVSEAGPGTIGFAGKKGVTLDVSLPALFLVPADFACASPHACAFIRTSNPRLAFAKVISRFFAPRPKPGIALTAQIGRRVRIGKDVRIGDYCVIGDNVQLGDGTVLNHHVILHDNTVIGRHCYIKSGAVIGEDGFGFDFEEDGTPVRIPHLGRVIIGDNVEIGAKTTIARGTIKDTTIGDHVKIDDQAMIAHNCQIGKNTLIIAFAEVSGSVQIGEGCWLGPNCCIIQKVRIGNHVKIGIGATVVQDIEDGAIYMGLEAKPLRQLIKIKKKIEY